jgi:tetratricopeptide (TPR) repeat protein
MKTLLVIFLLIIISPLYSQKDEVKVDTVKGNYYYKEGFRFYEKGNVELAEENLLTALKYNPTHIQTLVYISLLYYYTERYALASEYTLKCINECKNQKKTDGYYVDILKVRGYSLYYINEYAEAIMVYTELINDFKTNDVATSKRYLIRAICYKFTGELEKAYSDIIIAHQLDDANTDIQYNLGEILYHLSEYKKAIEVLSVLNQKGSATPNSYYYIGASYFEIKEYEKCIENHLMFLRTNISTQDTKIYETSAKYSIGISYYHLGQYVKALQYLTEIIDIYHLYDDSEFISKNILFMYGASLFHNKKNEEAKVSFKKAQTLFPNEGTYYQLLGDIYLLESNVEEAMPNLTKAYELGTTIKDSVEYYQQLLNSFLTLEDFSNALKCIDIVISLDKNNPANYRIRFDLYALDYNKNYNKILNDLDYLSVLYADNKEKSAYFIATKAVILISVLKHEEALKAIDEAIKLDPFYEYFAFRALINISFLLNENKEIEIESQSDVIKDLDKALTYNLRKQEIYMIKIIALMLFDRSDEACKTAKEAIKLDLIIDKEFLNYICKGKGAKRNNEKELIFALSSLKERFADDSGW